MTAVLSDVRVLEVGGRAAKICCRLFAQLGADVLIVPHRKGATVPTEAEAPDIDANKRVSSIDLTNAGDRPSFEALLSQADLLVVDLPPREIELLGLLPDSLCRRNPRLVVATITPFGLVGPRRDYKGGDLVAFHSSGVARQLVGHVDDPTVEAPTRGAGDQSEFISGLAAACAAIHALYQQQTSGRGQVIDVSTQEAMSLMAPRELAMPAFNGQPAYRGGRVRGGSAVIPVLPTMDGFVAVSPRETHQWRRWVAVMGNPPWGLEQRFMTRAGRTANYPWLYEQMSAWTAARTSTEIFVACQEAHVPCFPFGRPGDMLGEEQLQFRGFFAPLLTRGGISLRVPQPPFGLPPEDYRALAKEPEPGNGWQPRALQAPWKPGRRRTLPLKGIRVLDFSWVIAGPTCTRYLSLMGAEVIKVEAPTRPDTGRASELHQVLGQSKLALSIDVKAPGALEAMRKLVASCDVVIENFATGVLEKLGLGLDDLRQIRPDIVLVSASGVGRQGPHADWVAYGNLLSAFAGFSRQNGQQTDEPRTGIAWADPLCGLLLAFAVAMMLRSRDRGNATRHIDFSMLEALLWSMPGALIDHQLTGRDAPARGNEDERYVPHGVYRCAGDDRWLAIAVMNDGEWQALCQKVPALKSRGGLTEAERRAARNTIDACLAEWASRREDIETMVELQEAGIPASASYTSNDLFGDAHLWDRSFYRLVGHGREERFLPGLPWRWGDGSAVRPRPAPKLGQNTIHVLRKAAGLTDEEIQDLHRAHALRTSRSRLATAHSESGD